VLAFRWLQLGFLGSLDHGCFGRQRSGLSHRHAARADAELPEQHTGKAALQKVLDAFHASYPQVTVEPDITNFGQLNEKISTSLAGGQPYDVYITGVGWIPPFASKGLFADLSAYGVSRDSLAAQVNPAIIPAGLYDGKAYGIPLIVSPKPIAYRKSLFAAAGLDPNVPQPPGTSCAPTP
jgi:multiple sugar transport system substrate-binding protein